MAARPVALSLRRVPRRRVRQVVGCALASALLLTACGDDGPAAAPPEQATTTTTITPTTTAAPGPDLRRALRAAEATGVPGVVAIARRDGAVTVVELGAYADDATPAEDLLVDIGSVTKTVTGVLVARAVDEGLLRLDDTLGEIFPAAPPDKAGITVLQLLTHDAGLPDSVGDDAEVLSGTAFLDRVFRTPLATVPGDGYDYSNVGYGLLARILEERTGQSYDDHLRSVLDGSGIGDIGYDSVYRDDRSARSPEGASVREASWGGHAASWNLIGNGGLVADPAAIVRLRRAVTSGDLLSPALAAATQEPYLLEGPGATTSYGFGVVVDRLPGLGPFYWHDGGNSVFSSVWGDLPRQGDTIFVAASDTRAGDASTVLEALLAELYAGDR
jgi:CubicO group peptidase (beta-lactamase class C family)